jgi:hypothetical protein
MRYALAIAMTAAFALSVSTAATASKKHPHYTRHARGATTPYSSGWDYAPRPIAPRRCLQDEGYGRYTICGQGR